MKIVEYPVALFLKAWHYLFADIFGWDAAQSWLLALVLMIVTVRGLLLPFVYRQAYSSRILVNIRPKVYRLEQEYSDNTPEARKELSKKRRELQKEHEYRFSDGCVPMLVQLPVLLGLYRMLIHVTSPDPEVNASVNGFGPLNAEEVQSLLSAKLFDVPLAAYVQMSESQFAEIHTTMDQVFWVVFPMAILAAVFTTSNWAYSMYRNYLTVDHNSVMARWLLKLMWLVGPIVLIAPFTIALGAVGPVALMVYWVGNNLWTTAQTISIQRILDRKIPYSEEFLEHRNSMKAKHVEWKKEKKLARKSKKNGQPTAIAEQEKPSAEDQKN